MKTLLYIFISTAVTLTACAPMGSNTRSNPRTEANIVQPEDNGEEYELIIIDPGFNSWMVTNSRPVGFYAPQYYAQWNQRYVAAWNEKVSQAAYYGARDYPFENRINYDPTVDYGVELNYELYYYFRYIESMYGNRYNFPGFRRGKMVG